MYAKYELSLDPLSTPFDPYYFFGMFTHNSLTMTIIFSEQSLEVVQFFLTSCSIRFSILFRKKN